MKKIVIKNKKKFIISFIAFAIFAVLFSFAVMGIVYAVRGDISKMPLDNSYIQKLKNDSIKNESDIRVMSSNLLVHYKSWDGTPVKPRAKQYIAMLQEYMPDVLGLQELSEEWFAVLMQNMPSGYKMLYPLETSTQLLLTALVYNSNTLELKDSGSFVYSEKDNARLRRVVWGKFKIKKTGETFIACNTHLSLLFAGKEEEYRGVMRTQAKELCDFVLDMHKKHNCPVIATGDYNIMEKEIGRPDDFTEIYYYIKDRLTDCKMVATNKLTGDALPYDEPSYDHIFMTGNASCDTFYSLTHSYFNSLSDHYPIFADITLN